MRNLLFLVVLVFASCKQKETSLTAQQIIDQSILANGADLVANAQIEFDFRDNAYTAIRANGIFKLIKSFKNNNFDLISDVISNTGFRRTLNGNLIHIPDSIATEYASSVNSVHYFSVLPYGLNDKAVKKKLLGTSSINSKEYYKVEISFTEDGGGEDFEDIFIYWINKTSFKIDYLAYSFHVNGGGKRFREAINQRVVNNIHFADYNNFKLKNASTKLENLDQAFLNSQLIKVSEVRLENVKVIPLN
ncbi:MAG: deoxyribose-phosphate aldolase [Polaribacter sp.]|nr:deoxyribose-phosphate aldolase [Polaribacter sp.]MDG1811951.1 deoxyribose-phosphate aldolase [Polaribacter sp.]MDG1992993.1 deoxyribose-phosphate aldolase [Polaribacter sp.]